MPLSPSDKAPFDRLPGLSRHVAHEAVHGLPTAPRPARRDVQSHVQHNGALVDAGRAVDADDLAALNQILDDGIVDELIIDLIIQPKEILEFAATSLISLGLRFGPLAILAAVRISLGLDR